MKWWENPEIRKMYAVGQHVNGIADDGQVNGWMLEGLFETEEEAVEHCTENYLFIVPIPVGMMTGIKVPDGLWWPRLQTKEEGQARLDEARRSGELEI